MENKANEKNTETAKRKKGFGVISWIIIVIAAAVLVFALVNIIDIGGEDVANDQAYNQIKQAAVSEESEGDSMKRTIDFEALKGINEEIAAWIYVPNTNIDYPVVAGEDNDYYLSHNANGEVNRAGAVFLDFRSNPDFTDQNTMVYGHRMNNGSMFADLHKFQEEEFFRQNDKVYIYLPDGSMNTYRIFNATTVDERDDAYTLQFADDAEFEAYLAQMKERSVFETDVELTAQDRIITLSTCVRGQDTNRYIVQAVLEQ